MQHDAPSHEHLRPTAVIESDHPAVAAFAREHACGNGARECAVALYLAMRDDFRYDPYRIDLSLQGMRASTVLAGGYGCCVPKAVLLAAAARAAGIAARLGFADVRNHRSTERMRRIMRTDVFYWHGYTELWLDGAWLKATPVSKLGLCERFGLLPLEFDGVHDSLYHAFDRSGQRHMQYVHQGSFDDLPLAELLTDFRRHCPGWEALAQPDFQAEGQREAGS
ncbi:transglutaminase domain-containing protein [Comamonas sp. NLF-1-9]|uniref:transglutaminase domain-containing protein n=1 Tax=Comamonas sp. NLF-1-9 TaxID=2853163 RepID=UPI001C467C54|nr:transglutaminase domain-containing protein [Comamonas sp. NLF-1-9]QXL84187.1 transglutaminase family protein [Comamonas sp. NLF-1-9]